MMFVWKDKRVAATTAAAAPVEYIVAFLSFTIPNMSMAWKYNICFYCSSLLLLLFIMRPKCSVNKRKHIVLGYFGLLGCLSEDVPLIPIENHLLNRLFESKRVKVLIHSEERKKYNSIAHETIWKIFILLY